MTSAYDLSIPTKPTATKDPTASLDYSADWTAWLLDIVDTIASVTVTAAAPLALIGVPTVVGGIVHAFIAGGTVGGTFPVTFSIVTAGGRMDDRTIYLKIRAR